MARNTQTLAVDGRAIPVSNVDKILFPSGFTKGQVIDYYIRASPYLLPHLTDRPITLKRYPDGVEGVHFYEKNAPRFTPDWVSTFQVPRRAGGRDIRYILINDLATLVWCANLANLELHPFLHRAPKIDQPTAVVFDLDPGEGADILSCIEVSLLLKQVFDGLELQSMPKVSGSKGLQIYVPLNTTVSYRATTPFARTIAEHLAQAYPDLVVSEMKRAVRTHKVLVDWSQNSDFKTTAGVYSLRAKRGDPFVSMPDMWDELQEARVSQNAASLYWQPEKALERLAKSGDLFDPVLKLKQKLPKLSAIADAQPGQKAQRKRDSGRTARSRDQLHRTT